MIPINGTLLKPPCRSIFHTTRNIWGWFWFMLTTFVGICSFPWVYGLFDTHCKISNKYDQAVKPWISLALGNLYYLSIPIPLCTLGFWSLFIEILLFYIKNINIPTRWWPKFEVSHASRDQSFPVEAFLWRETSGCHNHWDGHEVGKMGNDGTGGCGCDVFCFGISW